MTRAEVDAIAYRFACFAARGTILLRSDAVHVKTMTYLGWWEQTIPLSDLKPRYGILTATPPIFIWAFVLVMVLTAIGMFGTHELIWGDGPLIGRVISALLLPLGVAAGAYLWRKRTSEWVIFNVPDGGASVAYTRQGPDAQRFEEFTQRLVTAIRHSRDQQN